LIRLSRGDERWSNCSPGRLLIVKTIEMLRSQGFRNFDFSLGEFPYKRRLGTRTRPLRDLVIAASVRGVPLAAAAYVRHRARQSESLRAFAQGIRGLTAGPSATGVITEAVEKEASPQPNQNGIRWWPSQEPTRGSTPDEQRRTRLKTC